MKKIMLMTLREEMRQMYSTEIEAIFKNYAEIHSYSFENQSGKPFNKSYLKEMDLILITTHDVYALIRNHIDKNIPIVYLYFTFMQDKIDLLKKYPRDTNAYVGFKAYGASFQTVSLLYELGLNNLNLKVYDPNYTSINDVDIAITGENSSCFPKEITNTICLGKRVVSFMTIMNIATSLGIIDNNLENRIYSYCEGTAEHDNCLNYFYGKSTNVKVQLQTIINSIDDAFIMLNHNYIILNHNTQLLDMFSINKNILNQNIFNLLEFSDICLEIEHRDEFRDELITINNGNKKILLSKQIIKDKDNKFDIYILLLKDVTNIINLENTLRKQIAKKGHVAKYDFDDIHGESISINNCINKARKLASIDKPTLIIGESGTGKELFAQSIHNNSVRKNFPFVAINCAALAPSLLESELFGYEEGSFTGAKKGGKTGLFEVAHKGTLLLDEVCEMSPETQAKLLRVLEEKEIMKVGGNKIISIDVKIIAATNKNLKREVDRGTFRLDLFFRLNTAMLRVPPLRERHGDIRTLAYHFLRDTPHSNKQFSDNVMKFLLSYPWPGNVRELKNCVEYMASISDGIIDLTHLPEYMNIDDSQQKVSNNRRQFDENEQTTLLEHEATKRILEILMEKNLGRRGILELLHNDGLIISEYRLREILMNLKNNGYIVFGKGRSGSAITKYGKRVLFDIIEREAFEI